MLRSTRRRRGRDGGRRRADRAVAGTRPVRYLLALATGVAVVAVLTSGLAGVDGFDPGAAYQHDHEFDLTVDGHRNAVTLEHVGGEPIHVDDLTVTVAVNGEALRRQPPVPFVGAAGFDGAPSGPFNAEADGAWEPGERAGVRVAAANEPPIEPGDRVAVTLALEGRTIARLETTAT